MVKDVKIKFTQLFIDNEFVDSVSGKKFPTINPSNEQKITDVSEADKADVDLAVAAAKEAFKRGSEWRKLDASARGNMLLKLAELIERDIDYIAELESLDNGKPLGDSVFDIRCALDVLRYYAGLADKTSGKQIPTDGGMFTVTRLEPVGVVGQIIPWNYPVLMMVWKLGPALAAGCTMVLKPSEVTPLTALYVANLVKEVGFPPGVVNVVPGYGPTAGQAIALHPEITKVAFTGSVDERKMTTPSTPCRCKSNPKNSKYLNQLFINNEFVDSVSGKTFETINPGNEQKITDVSEADEADVDLAVAAAKEAFKRGSEWRKLDASARGNMLLKLAELIERDIDKIAEIETLDNGKPLGDSVGDITLAVTTLRYYAGLADKTSGKQIPADGGLFTVTRLEPIGVVGQIIPWNFPVLMLVWKWGPALAAGCTIVMKPSELTPLTALYIANLSKEVGFPPGVINVLPGYGPTAGQAIASHPEISKVAFTGSVEVGRLIMECAAKSNLKKVSLELGGKSPLVVCNDVDIDEAVEIAHNAVYLNHGQVCCAGSRTFVQSKIYDEFVQKAAQMAKDRKVGDPFAKDTQQGPQINQKMFDKVLRLIESGKNEGATLLAGGARIGDVGFFIQPTVFADVTDEMTIAIEEIFGPVQTILKFEDLEEVIERANNTKYGLASGIITKDLNTALMFAQAVQAGSVWINCYNVLIPQAPFGGFKTSGIGRELGEDSPLQYMEVKSISIKMPINH